ncbi:hypothetical protein AA103196_0913 [Ameyamaea chiangmaiensis NBRC 103196]|nr:hypothetical protein AA103196_0913 [Ameyamaea chiangmaiensis NBRC 103196]
MLTDFVSSRQADAAASWLSTAATEIALPTSGARQDTALLPQRSKEDRLFRTSVDPRRTRPSYQHQTTGATTATAALILLTAMTKIRPVQGPGRTGQEPSPFQRPARRR